MASFFDDLRAAAVDLTRSYLPFIDLVLDTTV
jgi:hypothetical protein